MNWKTRWAKRILAKEEVKKINQEEEAKKARIIWEARKEELTAFTKKYVEEKREEFKTSHVPLHAIGDKVITNWYGPSDVWEGSASLLQQHTPFRGPLELKIKEVILDSSNLSETLYDMFEFDVLKDVRTYEQFAEVIKTRSHNWSEYPKLSWAYTIKVPGDEKVYWGYTWREAKLLKIDSKEAKYSVKAWKTEMQIAALQMMKTDLMKKAKAQIEKANHTKVKTLGMLEK